jgi:hypothetical protein
MSVPAFAWAIEQGRERGLSPAERLVLIYLADKANGIRICWPGQETIAEWTGLALRTVRTVVRALAKTELIRLEERPGRATVYHIAREDDPIPRQDVPGHTPAKRARVNGATPANSAGVQAADPGKSCPEPRHITTPTPANRPPEPVLTKYEPKTRVPAREEGQEARFQDSGEVGRKSGAPDPSAPDPLDRPVDPGQFQALLASIANGFQNNYPPRVSGLSRAEQIEAIAPPAIKPLPLAGAVLAAARAAAGVRVPA